MVKGFPVVLSDRGAPFVAVEKNAPLATVAENGRGLPIRVVDKGAPPLVIQGYNVWSPLDLFADGTDGTLWEPWDISTLFQDQAGTTPVTAGGDPVRRVVDKSGNSVPLSQSVLANAFTAVRMPLTGRRNLLAYTEALESSPWTKNGSPTITPAAIEGPDGKMSGYFIELPPSSQIYQVSTLIDKTASAHTLSVYLHKGDKTGALIINSPGGVSYGISTSILSNLPASGWERIAGTAPMNVSGTLNGFRFQNTSSTETVNFYAAFPQVNRGSSADPYQRVTNANDVHEDGVPDVWSIVSDYAGDVLSATLPFAIDGEILIAGTKGTIIEPVSYASGSTFNLGTDTYTGGTPGILRAIGPIVGAVLLDRAFTEDEKTQLIDYYKARGAKGLLVPGAELVNFDGASVGVLGSGGALPTGWASTFQATEVTAITDDYIEIAVTHDRTGGSPPIASPKIRTNNVATSVGETLLASGAISTVSSSHSPAAVVLGYRNASDGWLSNGPSVTITSGNTPIAFERVSQPTAAGTARASWELGNAAALGAVLYTAVYRVGALSIKELSAEEDW